ncbi:hypothetical protein [Streptomyces sp. NPDC004976]
MDSAEPFGAVVGSQQFDRFHVAIGDLPFAFGLGSHSVFVPRVLQRSMRVIQADRCQDTGPQSGRRGRGTLRRVRPIAVEAGNNRPDRFTVTRRAGMGTTGSGSHARPADQDHAMVGRRPSVTRAGGFPISRSGPLTCANDRRSALMSVAG